MKRIAYFVAAALLSLGVISGAQAATLPLGASFTIGGPVVAGNVDYSDVTLNYNSAIVKGDVTNQHVLPVGFETNKEYLSVYANGLATYSLSSAVTSLAFNWGTIDTYNTLTITRDGGATYDITGSDILALGASLGLGLVPQKSPTYFVLTDIAGIISAAFKSTTNSFEVADISVVPLPAALPLFGAALFGVAAARRRKAAV